MASSGVGARPVPIIGSIVVAIMLTITPLPEWLAPFRPDFVAMTLVYWAIHTPRACGVGVAWLVGLVLDVAQGTLLAQHALAMSLIVYLTAKFHLRLRVFPLLQMAATMLALLSIYRFVLFWINGVAGVSANAVTYWGPIVTGALLWPFVAIILRSLPYRRRARA